MCRCLKDKVANCCDYIDEKVDSDQCAPLIFWINRAVKGLGKVLVYVVYLISAFLAFASFAIILPYEQLYKSQYLLSAVTILGVYFLVNIQFHYYKARTIPPVANPGCEGDAYCGKCENWKSVQTHHCAVCGKCILGMDHHCIWINQCVGAHNHRHFFLFITHLTFATLTILFMGTNSIYDHIFMGFSEHTYCTSNLQMAPLQPYICEYDSLARNCIIFCYCLAGVLALMVGGLTAWNIYLISIGLTYIDYLRYFDMKRASNNRRPLSSGFRRNWKNFLGLRRNRTFFKNVILPATYPAISISNYERLQSSEVV